ncbi:hypothetical protein BV25DRAFT_381187 [Artomyces pyxidatus]|uniref:Uncharacterized protein n=1 Tax=Artomyces pyxidatus TaxID=48021 RepID=A0ACB8T4Q1_9AGAM|nr:hypothetical protein BV25DRAFT_381187 [Artomyces pyxidatus]
MALAVEMLPALLPVAVFFFFAGLVEFLFSVNTSIAFVVLAIIAGGGVLYVAFTISSLLHVNCPYRTPLSAILRPALASALALTHICLQAATELLWKDDAWAEHFSEASAKIAGALAHFSDTRASILAKAVTASDATLGYAVLDLTVQSLEYEDDVSLLLEGLPDFLDSIPENEIRVNVAKSFPGRSDFSNAIADILRNCAQWEKTPSDAQIRGAVAAMRAIRVFTANLHLIPTIDWVPFSADILGNLYRLRSQGDPAIAVPAACTAALLGQALLAQLRRAAGRPDSEQHEYFDLLFSDLCVVMHLGPRSWRDAIVPWITQVASYKYTGGQSSYYRYAHEVRRDLLDDGDVMNVVSFLRSILPHLPAVPQEGLVIVWATLRCLGYGGLQTAKSTPAAREAFGRLHAEVVAKAAEEDAGPRPAGRFIYAEKSGPVARLRNVLVPAFNAVESGEDIPGAGAWFTFEVAWSREL